VSAGHSSGWATATGRLFDPQGYSDTLTASGVEPKFHNLSIIVVRLTFLGSKKNKDLKILIKFAISCLESTKNIRDETVNSHISSVFSKDRDKTSKVGRD